MGTPLEIYGNPVSYFVADFFGSPSMNLIRGEVKNNGGPVFEGAGMTVPLPGGYSGAVGGCTLGMRPEHIEISPAGSGDGAALECEVDLVEPLVAVDVVVTHIAQAIPVDVGLQAVGDQGAAV